SHGRDHRGGRALRRVTFPAVSLVSIPATRAAEARGDLAMFLECGGLPPLLRRNKHRESVFPYGTQRPPGYFTYAASQSKNVLYQSWLFCGFSTQCPSSG